MRKFGISMPKGPDIDFSLSKKDADVSLPKAEAKVSVPEELSAEVEIIAPHIESQITTTKGSPSKYKLPTFKFPKFGGATPTVRAKVPGVDKDIKIDEADMQISTTHHVDVDAPDVKMEVHLPDVGKEPTVSSADIEGKLKKQRFSLPKLSLSKPSIKAPEGDVSLKHVNVAMPQEKVDLKGEVDMKTSEGEVNVGSHGSKFTVSKFGIQMPKVTVPELGVSLSKKDVDVTLPQAETELKFPGAELKQTSLKLEIKKPEKDAKVEAKLPEAPTTESIGLYAPVQKIEVGKPELEIKPVQIEGELDGQGSKFKMPKLGIKRPKFKVPETDVTLSKKDVDVELPDAKSEVKLPNVDLKDPSAKGEIKGFEIKGTEMDADGVPLKFKIPTLKLPKFSAAAPNISFEGSDKKKDIELPETKLKLPEGIAVDINAPSIESEGPSLDVKTTAAEIEGKGSKFKIPKLGLSATKLKDPEIDLNLAKKDVDVPLPYVEAEVNLPGVEKAEIKAELKTPDPGLHHIYAEGSHTKFKVPTFKLPRFGVGTSKATVEVPEADEDLQIDGADITLPRERPMIDTAAPKMGVEDTSIDVKMPESEVELDRLGKKFKMPSLGMTMPKVKGPEIHFGISKKGRDVTLPGAEAEVNVPEVQVKEHSANVEVNAPEIKVTAKAKDGSPSKFKLPTLKLPKFGIGTSDTTVEVPHMDKDIKIDGSDINIPEKESAVNIASPSIGIQGPTIDMKTSGIEQDGKGRKFQMPHLGFSMPQMKGPTIDLKITHKDVDVQLPKHEMDVKLPEAPKIAVDMEPPECDAEMDGHVGTFEIPKSEVKLTKVKGPEFDLDLSKKDFDVKLSKVETGVNLPDVDVSIPEAKIDVKVPEEKGAGIGLKLLMKDTDVTLPQPKVTTKLPDVPKIDVSLGKAERLITEANVEIKKPEVQVKPLQTDAELKGKGGKFKMSKFEITMPKVKGPDIDLRLSKKDVDVKLPEAKAGFELPEAPQVNLEKVDVSMPGAKIDVTKPERENETLQVESDFDGQGRKFKMRKFGISMPKGPDIDFSLSKKDADVSLPKAEAKVSVPEELSAEVEIIAPHIESQITTTKGSPSKYKLPTFKFPKFGGATPTVRAKVPGVDKDIKIDEADMQISTTHHVDVDVTLPEATAKVELPDAELKQPSVQMEVKAPEIKVVTKDKETSPSKFKLPTLKLPKFGVSTSSATAEISDMDKDIKIDGGEITIPEEVLSVKMTEPSIEGPSVDMKTTGSEHEVRGGKFKLPSLGFSTSKVKGLDVDVTLPEATAKVELPDAELKQASVQMEAKAPEIKVVTKDKETSPSKFKLPTLKLPKFGVSTSSATAEISDMDKDIKIDGGEITIPEEVLSVKMTEPSIEGPSVDIKTTGSEHEVRGGKFKLPSLGFSTSKVKGVDVDVTLPEATANVELPDAELKQPSVQMEVKAPEIKVVTKDKETSPSKFKLPTLKLPKFGVSTSSATAEISDMDKDIKIDGGEITIPEEVLSVKMTESSIKGPSVDIKTTGTEHDVRRGKFKLPSLGFSTSKGDGQDTDLIISKTDIDVTLPEANADVKLPDVELKQPSTVVYYKAPEITAVTKDKETSPSKFKLPTLKLPKFGVSTSSATAEISDMDKDIKIDGGEITIPEEVLSVKMTEPSIEGPSVDIKTTGSEHEVRGGKFKLPSLGFSTSKVKGLDVDVTLPEATAKVELPDAELKQPSVQMEVKAPEIKVVTKDKETSPSKFKLPTLKLPKFGVSTSSATAEISDMDKDIKIDGEGDILVKQPEIEIDGAKIKYQSSDVKPDVSKAAVPDSEMAKPESDGVSHGSPSKFKLPTFKMPKLSFSKTKADDEYSPVATEEEDHLEMEVESKGEAKSPKFTLGEILNYIDVEFDVPKSDKAEETLETSKEIHKTDELNINQLEAKEKKTDTKQDSTKSPEKKSWFQFPKFGLSSPSDEDKHKDEKSPVGALGEEESPTCSIQSSDAFADISSTMTSEHIGLSSSSPTKVTVKYSDPNAAAGLGEVHSNVITTRTETFSFEPDLPEKITILSSGVSSSSEDTGGRRPSCTETLDQPAHRMTEVMNSLEPGTEDFSGGGAGEDPDAIFPEAHERYPKLSKRLPSIVVEPLDAAEVESGELRWPPDEPTSPDAPAERQVAEGQAADEEPSDVGVDEEASGAEIQDSN
ncbi:hypothetical protein Q5P01_020964 [Channa striata]|uniref:LBH domain-containing protein n=1 Tax=Channa striata TaxID=64152 RepID=A0AA88S9L5_CHASR|nr:hypothetical protein Q5P01_020964 [Channa striata]